MNNKVTINDIARLTGLSKGTVDRVLHNRGEVSKKSYDKVMNIIREQGYKPNVFASLLAGGKEKLIAVLLPEGEEGSFWDLTQSGITKIGADVQALGVKPRLFSYDQYKLESFRATCAELLEAEPDGVVIAPLFREETANFVVELEEKGIPYAFVDSRLDTEHYLAYFGMPMYQSGYLCADQLTGGAAIGSVLMVRVRRDKTQQADPTQNRRAGFIDYMLDHSPECSVSNLFIDPNDPESIYKTLDTYFKAHPETRHIVMFNSRIHLLVPWLADPPAKNRRVVGFDNLPENIAALRRGVVTTLIGQRPDLQVARAIEALAEAIVLGKLPAQKDAFMHMDILTRYNVDYY